MADDSPSDWDSISETQPAREGRSDAEESDDLHPKPEKATSRKPLEPPYDFRRAISPNAGSAVPGRPVAAAAKRRHVNKYKADGEIIHSPAPAASRRLQSPPGKEAASVISSSKSEDNSLDTVTAKQVPKRQQATKLLPPADDGGGFDNPGFKGSGDSLDNPAFRGICDNFDIEERRDSRSRSEEPKTFPKPEEKIQVWTFEEPSNKFFRIDLEGQQRVWADKFIPVISNCCSWSLAELLGVIKIPFIIVFLVVGQLLGFMIEAVARPLSNFVLKPLLVSVHNQMLLPLCGFCFNCSVLTVRCVAPIKHLCSRESRENDGREQRDVKNV